MSNNNISSTKSAEILHTLSYFDFFSYPPNILELVRFNHGLITVQEVEQCVKHLVAEGAIYRLGRRVGLRSEIFSPFERNKRVSTDQLQAVKKIIPSFSWIPTVRFIGLSGSLSMLDADREADIDLFLITTNSAMWITRFFILSITRIFSYCGNHTARKLCWNIIVESGSLSLPARKQNEYVAHEALQLKPLFDRGSTYQEFLHRNDWILKIFPNVHHSYTHRKRELRLSKQSYYKKMIESFSRYFQLMWLNKKGYKVTAYEGQLWFIQDDFEKKIPLKLKRV